VDSDLYAALRYVSNDQKTDERMYVSGINCNAKRAYERITATKKRFGKTGGNVAYHGYQSFQTGETTPEEAHKTGMETARRMWGSERIWAMWQRTVRLDRLGKEYKFLCGNNIDSPQELVSFIEEKREQIGALEKERQSVYNRNRHKKIGKLNAQARKISAKIKPKRGN